MLFQKQQIHPKNSLWSVTQFPNTCPTFFGANIATIDWFMSLLTAAYDLLCRVSLVWASVEAPCQKDSQLGLPWKTYTNGKSVFLTWEEKINEWVKGQHTILLPIQILTLDKVALFDQADVKQETFCRAFESSFPFSSPKFCLKINLLTLKWTSLLKKNDPTPTIPLGSSAASPYFKFSSYL